MFRTILAGVSAFAIATSIAHAGKDKNAQAAEEAETLAQPAKILDAAHVTTIADAKAFAEAEFAQVDLDTDGSISKEEFLAYAAAKVAPVEETAEVTAPVQASAEVEAEGDAEAVAEITADAQFVELAKGDEALTKEELLEARLAGFKTADVNADETLDDAERLVFAALTAIVAPAESSDS